MPAPVVFIDTIGVAHNKSANVVGNTPFNDISRQGVQEVLFPPRQLFTRPLCFLTGAVRPFCLVFFVLEVVLVFAQRVPRIQQSIVRKRDSGGVTDPKVNTCCLLTG